MRKNLFIGWRRPIFVALGLSLASVAFGCLWGCQSQGSWDLHGELLGMKYQLAMTNTPPKPEEKPVVQTFDDFFQKWWESLWKEPAKALAPQPDHLTTTSLEVTPLDRG